MSDIYGKGDALKSRITLHNQFGYVYSVVTCVVRSIVIAQETAVLVELDFYSVREFDIIARPLFVYPYYSGTGHIGTYIVGYP